MPMRRCVLPVLRQVSLSDDATILMSISIPQMQLLLDRQSLLDEKSFLQLEPSIRLSSYNSLDSGHQLS